MDRKPQDLKKSDSKPNTLRDLYALFPVVRYKKNEIIYLAHTEPDCAYAIKSGFVKCYATDDTGDERSLSFVVKDELIPLSWLFDKSQSALFNYIAHTDCLLYRINPSRFHAELSSKPDIAHTMLTHMANDNVTKLFEIKALEQSSAAAKIYATLEYFCMSYGSEILKDTVRINVPLTQKDIASFTGLARETVTSEIIKLRKFDIVSAKKKQYVVNLPLLKNLMNETTGETPDLS